MLALLVSDSDTFGIGATFHSKEPSTSDSTVLSLEEEIKFMAHTLGKFFRLFILIQKYISVRRFH